MPDPAAPILLDVPSPGIVQIRLNRPERRNALATAVLERIAAALTAAAADQEVRVVLIVGAEGVFAAGADLAELDVSGSDDLVDSPRFKAWHTIRSFPKPLIAAVEGWCLGAGAELMMCADIVVVAKDAQIGQPETNIGIIPGAGGTSILPRRIGMARAMDMVLTGEPISGQEAWSLGLVSRLAETGEAEAVGLALAERLALRAPLAMQVAKASLRNHANIREDEHIIAERRAFIGLLGTQDKAEGIRAFKEKRRPQWAGR